MKVRFIGNDMVKIGMETYIKDVIECFDKDISKGMMTQAQKDIFEVDEKLSRLDQQKSDLFHTIATKLLYVSKSGRPDVQLAIAFSMYLDICQHRIRLVKTQMFVSHTGSAISLGHGTIMCKSMKQ